MSCRQVFRTLLTFLVTSKLTLVIASSAKNEVTKVQDTPGTCVWYGACGWDPDPPDHKPKTRCLNCAYEDEPRKFKDEATYEALYNICPHFK